MITGAALLELREGSAERGRGILEGVLRNYPKRLDLWSLYIDQVGVRTWVVTVLSAGIVGGQGCRDVWFKETSSRRGCVCPVFGAVMCATVHVSLVSARLSFPNKNGVQDCTLLIPRSTPHFMLSTRVFNPRRRSSWATWPAPAPCLSA